MQTATPRSHRRLFGALAGLALLAAACGSDATDQSATTDAPAATDAPAGTDAPAEPVATTATAAPPAAAADVPERIVSLSPTHTEMLFAIGAGDQVVAVDEFSDYPDAALELPHDLTGFEPNIEAISAYAPDLVITGGDFTGLGDQLALIDIAHWDGPAAVTMEDTYDQLEQLGAVTGNEAGAAEVISAMQSRITEILDGAPRPDPPLTVYHELDDTLYSVDSTTFIGNVYSLLGLQNIADNAEGNSFGYPQLNAEFIVSVDPDLIFLADSVTAESVAARPGWDGIAAVQTGNIFPIDEDIASRWGPRIVDYLAVVADAVGQAVADR